MSECVQLRFADAQVYRSFLDGLPALIASSVVSSGQNDWVYVCNDTLLCVMILQER